MYKRAKSFSIAFTIVGVIASICLLGKYPTGAPIMFLVSLSWGIIMWVWSDLLQKCEEIEQEEENY